MKATALIVSVVALTGCAVLTPEQSAALKRFHDGMQQAQYDLQQSQQQPQFQPNPRIVCNSYPGLDGEVQTICQ